MPAERLDFGYRRFIQITVSHVSEIARQRVSPLVSGMRAELSGVRRVRVVSVPPFPLELAKRNIFARSIDRNPEQNDEGDAFPLVRRLVRVI